MYDDYTILQFQGQAEEVSFVGGERRLGPSLVRGRWHPHRRNTTSGETSASWIAAMGGGRCRRCWEEQR
jgi:hypothetical protein